MIDEGVTPTAEREFVRSIELSPRYATAHRFFGWCLAMTGRFEEAYTEVKRAIRLDPLSSPIRFAVGCVLSECPAIRPAKCRVVDFKR
jgi:Tfp pilus assembly protein PilF